MQAAQPPLFTTICATCGGLGYIPEVVDGLCTGWADPCEKCSEGGEERIYDPWLADFPF